MNSRGCVEELDPGEQGGNNADTVYEILRHENDLTIQHFLLQTRLFVLSS